jgi:hypothetical protein
MSISNAERNEDIREALRRALEFIGETAILTWFNAAEPAFADILPTTWKHLVDAGMVIPHPISGGALPYQITGRGWATAAELAGYLRRTASKNDWERSAGPSKIA